MDDLVFGTPTSEQQRLERYLRYRSGLSHLSDRCPLDPEPDQPVVVTLSVGPGFFVHRAWVYYTADGTDPGGASGKATNGHAVEMQWAGSQWDDVLWAFTHTFRGEIPGQKNQTVVRYRIGALTSDGAEILADNGAFYAYCVDDDSPPEWAWDSIVYHIMVDRFARPRGQPWNPVTSLESLYGGNLTGILDRLDYLQDLGVNVLYLSPIFPGDSHHRYNATDYFGIDPVVGSKDDFRRLLDAAHRRGMRLVLDFVPNHWSDHHPTFVDAVSNPQSPYRDWYIFSRYPDEYECFFKIASMPRVNLRHPAARKYMIDSAVYWLKFGVDGYRIDHAVGPSADFWADFRLATRQVRPDSWLFGEAVGSPKVQLAFAGLLDGTLDFSLSEALRQVFATGQWDVGQLASFLKAHFSTFPRRYTLLSFLDNHDMDRFLWLARGNVQALKLAALCQFTLPDIPVVYYGTEVGLSQRQGIHDRRGGFGILEEARLPMLWGSEQNGTLLAYYRSLITLRHRENALRRGTWEIVLASHQVLGYRRSAGSDDLLVILNLSPDSQFLPRPEGWGTVLFATDSAAYTGASATQMSLLGLAGVVLKREVP